MKDYFICIQIPDDMPVIHLGHTDDGKVTGLNYAAWTYEIDGVTKPLPPEFYSFQDHVYAAHFKADSASNKGFVAERVRVS